MKRLVLEIGCFLILGILFLTDAMFGWIGAEMRTVLHIGFFAVIFSAFTIPYFMESDDFVMRKKILRRNFQATSVSEVINRKRNVAPVVAIWLVGLAILGALRCFGILTWQIFMIGSCGISMLNSWFIRKNCWLSRLMKNLTNCCKNCTICGWDIAFYGSALVFCPTETKWILVFDLVMFGVSMVEFVIWEVMYRRYPERFFQVTNQRLSCARCKRKCYRSK